MTEASQPNWAKLGAVTLIEPDKRYIPSYKRADQPPPMQLTERDRQIISAVYQYRLLSSHHIEALFFPSASATSYSRRTACQRRLQLLYHHGFLDRLPRVLIPGTGRSPYVYALDEAGADFIARHLGIDRAEIGWKPKHNELGAQFLDHSLVIGDVRVVIQRLADKGIFELEQWIDEITLKSAEMRDKVPSEMEGVRLVRKYPDGYFTLKLLATQKQAHFFLEVDQGTMTNSRWQEKVRAYHEFRRSGRSKMHYGTRNFRVLAVTPSRRRLQNLKQATEQTGGDSHFWFVTQEAVNIWQPEAILESVWSVATKDEKQPLFEGLEETGNSMMSN